MGITVIATLVNLLVVYMMPRYYEATSMLEVGGVNSYLGTPGDYVDTGKQSLPTSIQPDTQLYLNLANSPVVKDGAIKIMSEQLAFANQNGAQQLFDGNDVSPGGQGASGDFDYEAYGEPVRGTGTDMIYIAVKSDDPVLAKKAADALAMEVIEQSSLKSGEMVNDLVDGLERDEVGSINSNLAEKRREMQEVKDAPNISEADKNVRSGELADEIKALEETRKQYTDIIARVNINEALDLNNIKIFAAAVTPQAKEEPPFVKTGAVAAVLGLSLAIVVVAVLDRKKIQAAESIF